MNKDDEKLELIFKELNVEDPYAEKPLKLEDDFEEPIEVKLSDQSQKNMDKFFSVDDKEKKENFGMIRTLGLCAVVFIIVCICVVMSIKDKQYVDINTEGMKRETNWNRFVDNTKKEKESKIILRMYDKKGEIESKVNLKYDGENYSYGNEKEEYKYLLDEKGKLEDYGVNIRIIALANEKYSFEQLVNGLYKNADASFKNINLKDLDDAVNSINKLLDDIAGIEGEGNTSQQVDELNDIKYKLIYCF